MIYQLRNGRTIEISLEQYLDMSDEELEYLEAYGYGDAIENPWYGSVLTKKPIDNTADDISFEDLTSVDDNEKLLNPDIDISLDE